MRGVSVGCVASTRQRLTDNLQSWLQPDPRPKRSHAFANTCERAPHRVRRCVWTKCQKRPRGQTWVSMSNSSPCRGTRQGEKPSRLHSVRRAVQRNVSAFNAPGIREGATSVLIVVILAIGVVRSLPDAAITRAVSRILDPIALATGLDQNWSVFAHIPPTHQEDIEVRVAMADGTERVWALPRADPILGVAFSHRWRKLKENLLNAPQIRPDFVHWVVRQLIEPGDRAVHVDMLLLTVDIPPPGIQEPGGTVVETLYSENLTENR